MKVGPARLLNNIILACADHKKVPVYVPMADLIGHLNDVHDSEVTWALIIHFVYVPSPAISNNITLQHHLSLEGRKHKMIPEGF